MTRNMIGYPRAVVILEHQFDLAGVNQLKQKLLHKGYAVTHGGIID